MKRIPFLFLLAAAVALPAFARDERRELDEHKPVVTRKGKTVVQYKDEEIQVVMGYRHASTHLGSPWSFFETYLSATNGKPIEIVREDIELISPMGVIPLSSQRKMAEGIPDLRRMLMEAAVSRDPLDGYFPGRPRRQPIAFFTITGEGIVFDRVTVDRETLAGRLNGTFTSIALFLM